MSASTRETEIEIILAESQPYLSQSVGNLELLFDEALDAVERGGLPHRGITDRASWWQAFGRLKKEIAEQETPATATAVFAAGQLVDWAHSINLDLADYNIPIAILVTLAIKAAWAQMRAKDGGGTKGGDDDGQGRDLPRAASRPHRPDKG